MAEPGELGVEEVRAAAAADDDDLVAVEPGAGAGAFTSSSPSSRVGPSILVRTARAGGGAVGGVHDALSPGRDPRAPVGAEHDRQQVDQPVDACGRVGGQLLDGLEVEEHVAAGGVPADPEDLRRRRGRCRPRRSSRASRRARLEQYVVDRACRRGPSRRSRSPRCRLRPHRSRWPGDPANRGRRAAPRAAGKAWPDLARTVAQMFPDRCLGSGPGAGRGGAVTTAASRCRSPVARWAWRSTAARTAASEPTTRTRSWARVTAV